eukprot:CAMPEP_0182472000 /NCGR_PEP_ID=MMETSP1319-20130603/21347_1 /TAXON_ID=172717 /ORGANISM="Bolidomonas pacifica, Strain RCC208" /LENGTH=200 /DNA_ID=CAMNT_0024672615 /DNA_START=256 /DNA_END=855 /DNA_ORIENTATION=+
MVGSSQELDLQLLMYGERNSKLVAEIRQELLSMTTMDDMVASARKKGKGKVPPAKQIRRSLTPQNITEPLVNKRLSKQVGSAGARKPGHSTIAVDPQPPPPPPPIDMTEDLMIRAQMPTVETELDDAFIDTVMTPLSDVLHLVTRAKRSEAQRKEVNAANAAGDRERMKRIEHAEMLAAKQRKEAIEMKREGVATEAKKK